MMHRVIIDIGRLSVCIILYAIALYCIHVTYGNNTIPPKFMFDLYGFCFYLFSINTNKAFVSMLVFRMPLFFW